MNVLLIAQITTALLLTVTILLQSQSGGLGVSFGGSNAYHTKRGVEKGVFYLTIILSIVFTGLSLIILTI
jgi:protein translocase SecG subunit